LERAKHLAGMKKADSGRLRYGMGAISGPNTFLTYLPTDYLQVRLLVGVIIQTSLSYTVTGRLSQ
jgi:hypothetical protein